MDKGERVGEFVRPPQLAWCFICDKRLKPRALRIVDEKTGSHICSKCVRLGRTRGAL